MVDMIGDPSMSSHAGSVARVARTPHDIVHPQHPYFSDERVRVGFVQSSCSWVLLAVSVRKPVQYSQLRLCAGDHCVELDILDSQGLLEFECEATPGCYLVKLASA